MLQNAYFISFVSKGLYNFKIKLFSDNKTNK